MAYVEVHEELPDHPKTVEAAKRLRVDPHKLVGHLVRLWLWAQKYAPEGDLKRFSPGQIAAGAGWQSDSKSAQKFIKALLKCGGRGKAGFFEASKQGSPSSILLHDWEQYGGKLLRARNATRERVRKLRTRNVTRTYGEGNRLDKSRVEKSRVDQGERVRAAHEDPERERKLERAVNRLAEEWIKRVPEDEDFEEDVKKRMGFLLVHYEIPARDILDVIEDDTRRPKNRFKLMDYFKTDSDRVTRTVEPKIIPTPPGSIPQDVWVDQNKEWHDVMGEDGKPKPGFQKNKLGRWEKDGVPSNV